jgi:hypothetical protein
MPRAPASSAPTQQDRGAMTSPTTPIATEGLAKSKIEASGYTGVKDLMKNPTTLGRPRP